MSVAENIAFERNLGARLRLVNQGATRREAAETLEHLGVRIDLDAPVKSLSIAQRQLVAIARALVAEAKLVFMDEPTASLSRDETRALLDIVRKLSARNVAVVFVSHRLAEVLEICQRVTVLRDGRLVGTYPGTGMTKEALTRLMTGKTFGQAARQPVPHHGTPVLSVNNLTRRGEYRDVSLSVARGEVVGLIGRLGAGCTAFALSLFGMTRPDRGEIRIEGRPIAPRSNGEAIAGGIAYVPKDRLSLGLVQPQSIADNMAVTVLDRLLGALGLLSPQRRRCLIDDWIARLRIKTSHVDAPVSTLSGGNQQRVVLAKWLATEPRLLILDCPTVGVDVGARAGIFAIVRKLAAQGVAVLLISDETPEVYFNADRILHMRDGAVIGEFIPARTPIDRIEEAIHA